MATATITKRVVDSAKAGDRDEFIWDDEVRGFGLKITTSGKKVYIYQYRIARPGDAARTAPKRYTIGKHGGLTPDMARQRAKELSALVDKGIDPRQSELDAIAAQNKAEKIAAEKARNEKELLFEKVAQEWLAEYIADHRRATVGQAKLAINKYLAPKLNGKSLPHITKFDLDSLLRSIPAEQRALRQQVFAYISIFFRWSLQKGKISENPVASMSKPKGSDPRERVLTDEELATVWRGTLGVNDPFGAFYRLLILTGQRREEVAGMNWSQLDSENLVWVIPSYKAKNHKSHIVPLSPETVREIDNLAAVSKAAKNEKGSSQRNWPKSGPVLTTTGSVSISGFSKAKKALDKTVATICAEEGLTVQPWRVHDLRRTMATGFQALGIRFEVTEATLNHISGSRSGVAAIYQHHEWKQEKRSALEAWARHVISIVNPTKNNNVIALATAKN